MTEDRHSPCDIHGPCAPPYPEPAGKAAALRMNTTALAYLGDAIYELYVRKYIVDAGIAHADSLHRAAVRFVNAGAQATVMKAMLDADDIVADGDERSLVRRARNRKSASKPKNADPMDYKWATAFEALLGYYYLTEQTRKLEDVILFALNKIEGAVTS
ncbi:MAG: Mini-ribonuclease 3 [Clostridiales Family XIII bacterium]|jgi:ribonuclease-3 family protein|nr:Mini-ribonuclease 3 [Clostridiales Family XIII bacterium]